MKSYPRFDEPSPSEVHSRRMKFLRWFRALASPQDKKAEMLTDVYGLLQKAQVHLQLEQYDLARALLLRAIDHRDRLQDAVAISYILSALDATWLFTERYEDAIRFFSEYIGRYPQDSAAYAGRAAAFWYVGRLQEAIGDYSRALELTATDIPTLSGRGQVLAELGENARAMNDLNLALQNLKTASVPNSDSARWYAEVEAFVRNGRGFALAGLGESVQAMEELGASIRLSPENAWVYYNRAQIHDRAADHEKATADYQKALTMKNPRLNPIKKNHAQARLRELLNRS
jgi:tetratricopeptide (TPR) repeat protein